MINIKGNENGKRRYNKNKSGKYWSVAFRYSADKPIKFDYTYVKKLKNDKEPPNIIMYKGEYWSKYEGAYVTHTLNDNFSDTFLVYRKLNLSQVREREIIVVSD